MKKEKLLNSTIDFVNTFCGFVLLNLLFLITCLPIITIGTALSSLYYVMIKEARQEHGYLIRTYLKQFKNNLKSGTLAFIPLFIIGLILIFNIVFWYSMHTIFSSIIASILLIALILWGLTVHYTFPLIGRFNNSTFQTLKNSVCFTMTKIKPTLAIILIDIFVFFFCLYLPQTKLAMVLFGFSFIAYCQSYIFNFVFEPYENNQLNT